MERLTTRGKNGSAYLKGPASIKTFEDATDRLAYYEDMEEQGRLVVLPCKLGADIFRLGVKEVCAHWNVAYAQVFLDEIVMIDDSANVFNEGDIGKTVFLTREEAEQALKGGAN